MRRVGILFLPLFLAGGFQTKAARWVKTATRNRET